MKELLRHILSIMMAPVRWNYRSRNGQYERVVHKEIPNEILLGMVSESIAQGHTATISVKGISMRPFLENLRDKVQLTAPTELHDYDAVLAEIAPGHYVLHRIIDIQGDAITLMGDGNVRGVEHCRRENVKGVVTHYIRPRRTILASNPCLCRCIRLWRLLLPLRRYLLFIYKTCI